MRSGGGASTAKSKTDQSDAEYSFGKIKSSASQAKTPYRVSPGDDSGKIRLSQKYMERRKAEQRELLRHQLSRKTGPIQVRRVGTAEQISLAVGTFYGFGGGLGLVSAFAKIVARRQHIIRSAVMKVHATTFINESIREIAMYGNNVAGMALMYIFVGKAMSYLFEEELQYVPKLAQICLCGALTGALCRCFRGRRVALFAAGVGAVVAPLAHLALAKINTNINI